MSLDNHFENLREDMEFMNTRRIEEQEQEDTERDEWIEKAISDLRGGGWIIMRCGTRFEYNHVFDDAMGQVEPEDKDRITFGLAKGDKAVIAEFDKLIETELTYIKKTYR